MSVVSRNCMRVRFARRAVLGFGLGAFVSLGACGPGGGGGGSGGTGVITGGAAGAAGTGAIGGAGGASGASGDASNDAPVGGTGGAGGADAGEGAVDGTSDAVPDSANDAESDAAVSLVCGDGIRGLNEECDDGNNASDDACLPGCLVNDFAIVAGTAPDSGVPQPGRYLGAGRHPAAAGNAGFAYSYVEPGFAPPRVGFAAFNPQGVALTPSFTVSTGTVSSALLFSNPVLAALPNGKYAAAWTDFNGDGDELGVAIRLIDPSAPPTGEPDHANVTTAFSQSDPDVLWTGSELVVAWIDDSSASTGADLRYRVFDSNLVPDPSEQTLASSPGTESDVVLASFAGSWAAAWRAAASGGLETIEVRAGTPTWSVGPQSPAAPDDKPALVELDATTLLVVFVEGDAGTGSGSRLRGSILSVGSPGTATAFSLEPPPSGTGTEPARGQPNATRVGDRLFIAWRSALVPGNALAEELWLREASWDGSSLTLNDPIQLPRWSEHTLGDQRFPALAASPLPPEGALVTAWDDYGQVLGNAEGAPDVIAELIPVPILRTSTEGGGQ